MKTRLHRSLTCAVAVLASVYAVFAQEAGDHPPGDSVAGQVPDSLLDAAYGDLRRVKDAVSAAPALIKPNARGDSLLHRAIRGQSFELVKYLLDRGSELEQLDPSGRSPLHWASKVGREDIVEMLVTKGARVGALTAKRPRTALHEIAMCSQAGFTTLAVAEVLLAAGADLDARDYRGRTAAELAAGEKKKELARFLVEARNKPRSSFRSRAPEPSARIRAGNPKGKTHVWEATSSWPVRYVTAWYSFDVDGCEHSGGGSRRASAERVTFELSESIQGNEFHFSRGRIDRDERNSRSAIKSAKTTIPAGSKLVTKSRRGDIKLTREYSILWEGRFMKDGEVVKTVLFAIRAANRNDTPPLPTGPPFDVALKPFKKSLFGGELKPKTP